MSVLPGTANPLHRGLLRHLLDGGLNSLSTLVLLVTLGLLAYMPLGADAARVGLAAAFAAVIAGGLVYALLGSTASPAGSLSSATALILAGLVARLAADPLAAAGSPAGLAGLLAVASLAVVLMGALQMLFALLGLGRLARFVPQPVLAGFMNGVAILILWAQLPPLLGLPPLARLTDAGLLAQARPLTLAVGVSAAAAVWLTAWRRPRWPAPLVGLVVGCAVYAALALALPGRAIGTQVGPLPQGMVLPDVLLPLLGPPAQALLERHAAAVVVTAALLAVIGSLESLLVALANDPLTRARHDSRRELLALGAGNMASGICGGLPLVLSRMRSVALIGTGATGRRPLLAATLAFVMMYAAGGGLLALLPKAVLAGIMLTVAVALLDSWTHQLLRQLRAGDGSPDLRLSLLLVASVCAITVAFGFVAAVAAGVVLAMLVFMRSMNRSLLRGRASAAERPSRRIYPPAQEAALAAVRGRVQVLDLEGALFFGSAERLAREAEQLAEGSVALVLDLRRVSTIDETGAVLLEQTSHQLARRGVMLLLAGVSAHNEHGRRLRAYGCFRAEPRPDWWPDTDLAVESAERHLLLEAGYAAPQSAVPLSACSLLRGLEDAERLRVEAALQRRRLPAGSLLLRAGDPGDCLYVLTEGSISITGTERPVPHRYVSFSPGVMLGEIAMLDGQPRTADARADTDSVVHVFTRAALAEISAEDPRLAERLVRNIALHLAERLRAAAGAWRAGGA